jgi:hypothetical protein
MLLQFTGPYRQEAKNQKQERQGTSPAFFYVPGNLRDGWESAD